MPRLHHIMLCACSLSSLAMAMQTKSGSVHSAIGQAGAMPSWAAPPGMNSFQYLIVSSPTLSKIVYTPLQNFESMIGKPMVLIDSGLMSPRGLAMDPKIGALYVADAGAGPGSGAIYRYGLQPVMGGTTPSLQISGERLTIMQGHQADSITLDAQGNMYYTDPGLNNINKISNQTLEQLGNGKLLSSQLYVVSQKDQEYQTAAGLIQDKVTACSDTPWFVDEKGYYCQHWQNSDCGEAVSLYTYTDDGMDALRANCRKSCGVCTHAKACADSVTFLDEHRHPCADWTNHDCSSAVSTYEYSQDGEEAIKDMCKQTCGTCAEACKDNPTFKDEQGLQCDNWLGKDCRMAHEQYGYSQVGEDNVLDHCQLVCKVCEKNLPVDQQSVPPAILSIYEAALNPNVSAPSGVFVENDDLYWTNKISGKFAGTVVRGHRRPVSVPSDQGPTPFDSTRLSMASSNGYGVAKGMNTVVFARTSPQSPEIGYVSALREGTDVMTDLATDMRSPRSIIFDGDETMYVADEGMGNVWSFPVGRMMGNVPKTQVVSMIGAYGLALYDSKSDGFSHNSKSGSGIGIVGLPLNEEIALTQQQTNFNKYASKPQYGGLSFMSKFGAFWELPVQSAARGLLPAMTSLAALIGSLCL